MDELIKFKEFLSSISSVGPFYDFDKMKFDIEYKVKNLSDFEIRKYLRYCIQLETEKFEYLGEYYDFISDIMRIRNRFVSLEIIKILKKHLSPTLLSLLSFSKEDSVELFLLENIDIKSVSNEILDCFFNTIGAIGTKASKEKIDELIIADFKDDDVKEALKYAKDMMSNL